MHIHLSAALVKDMRVTDFACAESSAPLAPTVWFAHRVTLRRRKCVIAIEDYSRYTVVFCGWTGKDFQKFPSLFAKRLQQEALVALYQPDQRKWERLPILLWLRENQEAALALNGIEQEYIRKKVQSLSAEIVYHKSLSRSTQAHIKDAFMQLEVFVDLHLGRLPETPEEEMLAAAYINETPRCTTGKDKDAFFAPARFREFWTTPETQPAD